MRPTDVDKIAEAIVGSLAGGEPGLLGCGAISSPTAFEVDMMTCGTFECGVAAAFTCTLRFNCGVANGAINATSGFFCPENFGCDQGYLLPCVSADLFGCDVLAEFAVR